MDAPELLAEAERLARPCVLLKRSGRPDRLAGVWGGPGLVSAPEGPFRHWLSIDCQFLPAGLGPTAGVLSVYTNQQDCVSGIVMHAPGAVLARRTEAALYAHSARSLPPIDAVFRFGNEAMQAWLHKNGWQAHWGYNGNFPDPAPAEAYERIYHSECPRHAGGAAAVLGGWHFPWPDGDWEKRINQPLLIWTLEESEPWVEVWGEAGGFLVLQRIT